MKTWVLHSRRKVVRSAWIGAALPAALGVVCCVASRGDAWEGALGLAALGALCLWLSASTFPLSVDLHDDGTLVFTRVLGQRTVHAELVRRVTWRHDLWVGARARKGKPTGMATLDLCGDRLPVLFRTRGGVLVEVAREVRECNPEVELRYWGPGSVWPYGSKTTVDDLEIEVLKTEGVLVL